MLYRCFKNLIQMISHGQTMPKAPSQGPLDAISEFIDKELNRLLFC